MRSYQPITLLLQSERLKKLRFTPLLTTIYLSYLPSPTSSHNLSSNRFPKCIRYKGCCIFLKEVERRITKSNFRVLKKLYQVLFICKELAADDDACLGWGWPKTWLFRIKEMIFCNSKHFNQNIMCCAIDTIFPFFYIFHFFQIIMVSLFLAWHDQYFIMFKDLNVFEFTNFPFKTKYNNNVVYSVNSNYLFLRENKKKVLKFD